MAKNKATQAAWRAKNIERVRAYYRTYFAAHTEEIKAYQRKWAHENKERCAARKREWVKKNREKRRQHEKTCRENNPARLREKNKRYIAAHREQLNAKKRARRRLEAARRIGKVKLSTPAEIAVRLLSKAAQLAKKGYSGHLTPQGI